MKDSTTLWNKGLLSLTCVCVCVKACGGCATTGFMSIQTVLKTIIETA